MQSYADQLPGLREFLSSAAPAEVLAKFDEDATALGRIDFTARTVKPGQTAPDFTLSDPYGGQVTLSELLARGPVVLTFYRGTWCPYCNLQLRTYQQALPRFAELGAQLVAVSPQTPDNSLSMAEKNALEFPVLSDPGNATARAYGLVFEIDEAVRELYLQAGTDLLEYNGGDSRSWELPAPATYVIAPDGTVVFAKVDGDIRNRTEPADILDALETLQPDAQTQLTEFLNRLGTGDLAGAAALCADPVDWRIPGSDEVPWTGVRTTPSAVADTLAVMTGALVPQEFVVSKILADGSDAVALGRFTQMVKDTGRTFTSEFALHITVRNGKIISYRIHEDTLAVARGVV